MDISRLRQLAGSPLKENTGAEEIISHLEGLAEQVPGMGLDDDVEEGVISAIYSCMGQIEELVSGDFNIDGGDDPYPNMDDRY